MGSGLGWGRRCTLRYFVVRTPWPLGGLHMCYLGTNVRTPVHITVQEETAAVVRIDSTKLLFTMYERYFCCFFPCITFLGSVYRRLGCMACDPRRTAVIMIAQEETAAVVRIYSE
ncbi:unnamed protein product [Ectocarpus fasciculatus]